MSIDVKTALKVAKLARLSLKDDQIDDTVDSLNRILNWIEQLQAVPTTDVDPMLSVHLESMPKRPDVVTDGGYETDILANAPDGAYGLFAIQKFVE